MLLNLGLALFGFILLVKCADYFVEGASSLAKNFKVSTLVIGLTIVAFGTSAPEIAISFNAHFSDNADLLFGNVVGSSITNILVILGLAILIKPFKIHSDVVHKQIPILLLVTAGLSVLLLDMLFDSASVNALTRADSVILILFFSIFIYYLVTILKADKDKKVVYEEPKYKLMMSIIVTLLALGGIIFGSNIAVDNLEAVATAIGISQKIISVTIVAVGTSLPELVTIVIAAKKGETTMAIGNIVSTNIFNICIVLGLPIIMLGGVTTASFNIVDTVFMLVAVLLLWRFSATDREMKRYEGALLLATYSVYVGYVLSQ